MENEIASEFVVKCGVPHGTALGPILFLHVLLWYQQLDAVNSNCL